MKFLVNISRDEALVKAQDEYGLKVVTVHVKDLSESSWDYLRSHNVPDRQRPEADFDLSSISHCTFHGVLGETARATVELTLCAFIEETARRERVQAGYEKDMLTEACKVIAEQLTCECYGEVRPAWPTVVPNCSDSAREEFDQIKRSASGWVDELKGEYTKEKAEERALNARKRRDREQAHDLEESTKLAWINEYGSLYLKNLVRANFDYDDQYASERIDREWPEWLVPEDTRVGDWTDLEVCRTDRAPTADAVALLLQARQTRPGCLLYQEGDDHYFVGDSIFDVPVYFDPPVIEESASE